MQQAPCKCATVTENAGTLLEEATFSLEYFIQNKDLVVKQTHLNDAHREKLFFGQKKLAAVPAIYKNQSQPKHSLSFLLPALEVPRGNSMCTENQVTTEVVHLQE